MLSARAASLVRALEPTADGRVDVILGPGLRYEDAPSLYHAIWTVDGTPVDRSDAELDLPRPTGPGAWNREGRRELAQTSSSGVLVLVGRDLADVRRDVWSLATTLMGLGGGILILSAAGGWWLVGRALEPLDRINRTARLMTGGDLTARIQVDSVDSEVSQLTRALNGAFDRLQEAVDRQRRFTGDASHELRTPLATLSTEVQWALARPRTPEEMLASLEVCGRAAVRMQSVIERLLVLARGDAPALHVTDVALDDVARSAIEAVRPLADAAHVELVADLAPVMLTGDADRLREAITNVLTNAIRYNVDHGQVHVQLTRHTGMTALSVRDTGIGIDATDLPSVFEPFFRGDPARSRDTGGAGLGLAVARTVVSQHGGTMTCTSERHRGTTIEMCWPISEPTPPDQST
jgi:signal transduction histidine kinase